jgi:antitoxin VapB
MPLNIKDAETEQLASDVVALTGESKTAAVRTALRERRARLLLRGRGVSRSEAMRRYLTDEVWPQVPPGVLGSMPSQQEQDDLLGYENPT